MTRRNPMTLSHSTLAMHNKENHKMSKKQRLVSIFAATIGNLLEWQDFTLFGLLSDEIGRNFFSTNTHAIQTVKTFGIFAVAFLIRPLGALIFGYVGDKHGRAVALRMSLFLMAIPTFCIGCLPNYSTIGSVAPLLLILCRLLQGLSVGGEFPGALTYTLETSRVGERVLYTVLPTATAVCGVVSGSLFVGVLRTLCTETQMNTFGWRIPFLFGVIVIIFGVWTRQRLQRSVEYWLKKREGVVLANPIKEVFVNHKWNVLSIILHYALHAGCYYVFWVWFPAYMYTKTMESSVYLMNGVNLIINICVMIASAYCVDRYMKSNPILLLVVSGSLLSVYVFIVCSYLIRGIDGYKVLFVQMGFAVLDGVYASGLNIWAMRRFRDNTMMRYSGIGVAYNITFPLFGGTAPLIASGLILEYHGHHQSLSILGILLLCYGIISVTTNIICHWTVDIKHANQNIEILNQINASLSEVEPLEQN
eukprot:177492_1